MPQDRKTLASIEQTGDRRAKVPLVMVTGYVSPLVLPWLSSSVECMVSDKLENYELKKIGVNNYEDIC